MGCGASSSNIVINIDRTNPFYFGGEIISGTVQLYINDAKLEVDEVDLNLIGELGYITRTTTNVNGRATTHTEHHNIPFLATKYVFARPQAGQKEITITQGQYSWPFQIQLPAYLPPTLGLPEGYPHVRYYLQVLIDKAWYKPNTRENRYITVFPRINLLQQPNCLMPNMFGNHNRKDIIVKGALNKLGYVPGEMIQGTIEIDNPRQVLIKQIDLSLIKSYQIASESHTAIVTNCLLSDLMRRKDERIVQTFGIMIPSSALPPSCQFQGGIRQIHSVNVNYTLKFEVKVEGMFTDFEVIVPIIMGTEPMLQQPRA